MTYARLGAITFRSHKQIEYASLSLTKAGVICSDRGRLGALYLARPATEITLYEVVDAVNNWPSGCKEWNYMLFGLKSSLKRITLSDIIDGARTY